MEKELITKALKNKIILLTGAGGGIGYETARSFASMGATVLIAEVDKDKGLKAVESINKEFKNSAVFFLIDLSNKEEVIELGNRILKDYGCPDCVFNNAAKVVTGSVGEFSVEEFDHSYFVNLRAPLILTNMFLPLMKKRDSGCFVFVSSSGAAPYLGGYETFKTAQVELSNTLAMELEGSHVYSYTIAPGLVRTKTAERSIEVVASKMGMSLEEFYKQNDSHILSVKDAGRGFALSLLKAKDYNGQEISSIQAINDFEGYKDTSSLSCQNDSSLEAKTILLNRILTCFFNQYEGWKSRNVFERQWVYRDFKKSMSMSVESVDLEFKAIKKRIESHEDLKLSPDLFKRLLSYWEHQNKLLQGFEKDKEKLASYSLTIKQWIKDIESLLALIK